MELDCSIVANIIKCMPYITWSGILFGAAILAGLLVLGMIFIGVLIEFINSYGGAAEAILTKLRRKREQHNSVPEQTKRDSGNSSSHV